MRIDLRRCTLAALFSLNLVGCATVRESAPQTIETSDAHAVCDVPHFRVPLPVAASAMWQSRPS
jgi:hypothetical protein